MPVESLRVRQASLARTAIFEALVRHLEADDADEVSMEQLAAEAGVSRRTLYRYFPNRSDLLAEAGEWIRDELLRLPVRIGDEGITESFRAAASQLQKHPRVARALLRSQTGRAVRGGYREERVKAIRSAVHRAVPGLSSKAERRAAALVGYLCSSQAWIAMQDESGLDAASAQSVVVWAIDTVLARLREDAQSILEGGKRP